MVIFKRFLDVATSQTRSATKTKKIPAKLNKNKTQKEAKPQQANPILAAMKMEQK